MLSKPVVLVAIIVALLFALVGVQGLAASVAPAQPVAKTGQLLGDAGFAYLGGLRVFGAAVLWNRLEPQFDQFYDRKQVKDLTFLMPSLYLIQRLDPQFVQSYYNAAFILGQRGQWGEALGVARDGIANNPASGLMRANYVQLLLMQDKQANLAEAYKQSLAGIGPEMTYATPDDQYESLAIFRTAFKLAGRTDLVTAIETRLAELEAAGAQPSGLGRSQDGLPND